MSSESETAIAVVEPKPIPMSERGIAIRTLDEAVSFAQAIHVSGMAPKGFRTPAQILVAMQYGAEIGLSKMQSLTNIAVINGRAALWGDALPALVLASGKCESILEVYEGKEGSDDYTAVCTVVRKGSPTPIVSRFSVADAKVAGIWGKDIWKCYPARMLKMRARAWALRDGFADVLCGMGIVEEVRDYAEAAPAAIPARVVPITNGQQTTAIQSAEEAIVEAEVVPDGPSKEELFIKAVQLHDDLNPGPELWGALLVECDVPMNSDHVRKLRQADSDCLNRIIERLQELIRKTAATSERMGSSTTPPEASQEAQQTFQ